MPEAPEAPAASEEHAGSFAAACSSSGAWRPESEPVIPDIELWIAVPMLWSWVANFVASLVSRLAIWSFASESA